MAFAHEQVCRVRDATLATGLEGIYFLTRRSELTGETDGLAMLVLQCLTLRRRHPDGFLLCGVAFLASGLELACSFICPLAFQQ